MLNFVKKSLSAKLFLAIVGFYVLYTGTTQQIHPWGAGIGIACLILYFFIVADLYKEFRGEPIDPWDVFRFSFFGFLAMFPVFLLSIVPYLPYSSWGGPNIEGPMQELTLFPLILLAKCWFGLGILLSIYEKDQVGVMKRSWYLGKNNFREFLPVFSLVAIGIFYQIANELTAKDWLQVVLIAPVDRILDTIVLPYLYFQKFKKLGRGPTIPPVVASVDTPH